MTANENKETVKSEDDDKSEIMNMSLLVLLYILQGIPTGLANAMPLVLQSRGVTYDQQAQFSIVVWPYTVKVLWAPLVEAIPSNKFGKRKSFVVPIQYILGVILIIISTKIDIWLGDPKKGEIPNISMLTIMFLLSYTLAALQDTAVDGWALTMLSRKNIGHSATCQTVGGSIGNFFGFVASIVLDSADFCNKWIRSKPQSIGIVPLSYTIGFWGVMFIIITTLIAVFKKENVFIFENNNEEVVLSSKQSYIVLWEILKLKPMKKYILLMITCGIMYAACLYVAPLKFIDVGVPKEKFAMMDVPLIPIHMLTPFILSRFITSDRPINLILVIVPYWIVLSVLMAVVIYIAPFYASVNGLPGWYIGTVFILYGLQHIIKYCREVGAVSFNAQTSDPRCASTYITLMHTVGNIGNAWSASLAIWLVDKLTWKECTEICILDSKDSCNLSEKCEITIDGYYIETIACTVIAIIWLMWAKKVAKEFHSLERSAWLLKDSILFYR